MARITIDGSGDCSIGDVDVDELVINLDEGSTLTLKGDVRVGNKLHLGAGTCTIADSCRPMDKKTDNNEKDEFEQIVDEEIEKLRRKP